MGNGCFGENFHLNLHWKKVSGGQRSQTWDAFCSMVRKMRKGQIWRHNQAGDLPGVNDKIDSEMMAQLVSANKGRDGFTYTHKPLTDENLAEIRLANAGGFTVNISANSIRDAVIIRKTHPDLPVVCVLDSKTVGKVQTVDGVRIVTCPASLRDDVTCYDCGLCQRADRDYVIGFPAHGSRVKKVDAIVAGRMSLTMV